MYPSGVQELNRLIRLGCGWGSWKCTEQSREWVHVDGFLLDCDGGEGDSSGPGLGLGEALFKGKRLCMIEL
ncbi:hypothetical protein CCACVL1_16714 [Corchorus capsularis]|uniref:Uncharacterized protein n=1 Tax=Corchorus capsularis TaxID=210143 RepID=A0A1R3HVZ5_COCAP|nr:hypothetical protein CCACVL1_16714 [Corchorus capsularis]